MNLRATAPLLLLVAGCAARLPPVELAPHPEPDLVGATHVVKPGETLWSIARAYGTTVEDLALTNHLDDARELPAGLELFVPGAAEPLELPAREESPPPPKPADAGPAIPAPLAWPLHGVLYARFGPRGETRHDGIDLAAPAGSVVRAAAAGLVLYSGEQRGYGHLVIVEHQGGLVTLYAHNRANLVREGQRVEAGAPIAEIGFASRTSGPHLHFEVREKGGQPRDPLKYLPPPR